MVHMAQVMSPSGHSFLLYFFSLLLYPSFTCISTLALYDRMHKADFANRDFPLLLMILRSKLHTENNMPISHTSSTMLPLLSLGKHMDGPPLSPFHLSAIRDAIFDKTEWGLRVLSPATSFLAFILIISLL